MEIQEMVATINVETPVRVASAIFRHAEVVRGTMGIFEQLRPEHSRRLHHLSVCCISFLPI
jgi:hypothetical protein